MYVSLYVCKRTHDTGDISSVGQGFYKKKLENKRQFALRGYWSQDIP